MCGMVKWQRQKVPRIRKKKVKAWMNIFGVKEKGSWHGLDNGSWSQNKCASCEYERESLEKAAKMFIAQAQGTTRIHGVWTKVSGLGEPTQPTSDLEESHKIDKKKLPFEGEYNNVVMVI